MSPVRYLHEVLAADRTTAQDSPEMAALIARVRSVSWLQAATDAIRQALVAR